MRLPSRITPRNLVREALRRLEIKDGDVLLIKQGSMIGNSIEFSLIQRWFARTGKTKVVMAMVNDWDDVKTLDEQKMNELGWYRKDAIE